MKNRFHRRVIEQDRAVRLGGLGEIDQQARIIELSVVVKDPAAQTVFIQRGNVFENFLAGEAMRFSEAVSAG